MRLVDILKRIVVSGVLAEIGWLIGKQKPRRRVAIPCSECGTVIDPGADSCYICGTPAWLSRRGQEDKPSG